MPTSQRYTLRPDHPAAFSGDLNGFWPTGGEQPPSGPRLAARQPAALGIRGSAQTGPSGKHQLLAERADERPAVNLRLVVGPDQYRVLLGRVEGKGPDEPRVADEFYVLHHDTPHAEPVVVVAQGVTWRKGC